MKTILIIMLLCLPATAWSTDMIAVPVTLTYQGKSVSAIFAVDTGATITVIGTRLADRIGIPRDTRNGGLAEMADGRKVSYRTAILDVTAGNAVTRKGMKLAVMEYGGGSPVDGILGMDFHGQMTMVIDWKSKRVTWIE